MYRNIMFDLDGTVTDSGRAIMGSVECALSHFGFRNQPAEKLRTFIGPSLFDSFEREYGMNEEDCKEAVRYYREDYEKGRMYEVDLYEGIPELIKELKTRGFRIFLVTSKPKHFSERIAEHIGLLPFFDDVIAPELTDHSSDKKRLIDTVVSRYALKREECLMIGDTQYDIRGAKNAGVDSVGVTYGYGKKEELEDAGATYLVNRAAEIAEVANLF